MDLLGTRRVDPVHQSPRTRMYGYFTHGTDPPPRPCSSGFLSLPNRLRRLPFPAHFRRRLPAHAAFTALVVLRSRPSTDGASLAISLRVNMTETPSPRLITVEGGEGIHVHAQVEFEEVGRDPGGVGSSAAQGGRA